MASTRRAWCAISSLAWVIVVRTGGEGQAFAIVQIVGADGKYLVGTAFKVKSICLRACG